MIRTSLPMRWAVAGSLLLTTCPAFAQSLILPEGMAIQLETRQEISSKTAHAGDPVDLTVAKPIVIGGVTLIPAGSPAIGEVSRVRDNGLLGRSGKLDIKVSVIKTGKVDVPVRGERNSKGKSGTLGAVGAGIVFLPLAVIVRGKDVKLPAGTRFEVYADQEIVFPSDAPSPAPLDAPAPSNGIRVIDPNAALGN